MNIVKLARRCIVPVMVWAALSVTLLSCTDPAHAQGGGAAPYVPQLAQQREEVLRQLYGAYRCMYSGSVAMFRQGVTDRHRVTLFTISTCSAGAGTVLRLTGVGQDEAATMLVAVADKAYEDALSWGRP